VIDLEPAPGALLNRGSAHFNKGDYRQALADYGRAIEMMPTYAEAFFNRGSAAAAMGELDGAIADFSRAIALKPTFVDAYYSRAGAYDDKGDFRKAIPDYDEALRLKPDHVAALINRCWTRAVIGEELETALADCNAALRFNAGNAVTLDTRALVALRMGRYREAITDYDFALQRSPKLASALFGRGIAQIRTGNVESGRADIAAAERERPGMAARFARFGITP
jgi:tetratricopeptide (TPR) repeat protein